MLERLLPLQASICYLHSTLLSANWKRGECVPGLFLNQVCSRSYLVKVSKDIRSSPLESSGLESSWVGLKHFYLEQHLHVMVVVSPGRKPINKRAPPKCLCDGHVT